MRNFQRFYQAFNDLQKDVFSSRIKRLILRPSQTYYLGKSSILNRVSEDSVQGAL